MAAPGPSLASAADTALLASTSSHERLLLAQAVFARGKDDYAGVAQMLRGHALLRRREEEGGGWFAEENLRSIYEAMVRSMGLDASVPRAAQGPELRKIAHKWYMDRVYELHAGMQECQDQFRIVYSELAELKEGKLDWRFTNPERLVPPGSSPVRPDAALPDMDIKVEEGVKMEVEG
ncbi:hypothetical protein JCM8097_005652 [Rhodosporidiobolus ruineniae]